MAIQSATKKTMNEYLNNIYYIPMNQRDYTWETDQLEDFWQDLLSVKNNQGRQHFFGMDLQSKCNSSQTTKLKRHIDFFAIMVFEKNYL